MPGKVVHFELPADNVERAKTFYMKAFGWEINQYPGMQYHMVGTTPSNQQGMPTEPGAINGGLTKRQDPNKNIVITIDVPDIEASLKNIEKLGGKTVKKKEPVADMGFTSRGHGLHQSRTWASPVADMGFTAYFKDPEGNIVGLWQSARRM